MATRDAVAELTVETVADSVDYLVLAPDKTFRDIEQACRDAVERQFSTVCLPPYAVGYAARLLRGQPVGVGGAVGMPFGHSGRRAKCDEASIAVEAGAREVDMVLNLVAMKSGRFADVESEIAAVRKLTTGLLLKVTLECCYLTDAEKVRACRLALDGGADVVKSHTGFGQGDVRVHDVSLLARAVGHFAEVEVAGHLDRFKRVHAMMQAGATRIATDAAVPLIEDFYEWEVAQ